MVKTPAPGYSIKPTAAFYTLGYFLGYNMVGSFLISMFVPVVTLSVLNTLIWRRLRQIWSQRGRLGVRERRNTRAAVSLVFLVILFFVCHSPKLVVSGYQVRPAPPLFFRACACGRKRENFFFDGSSPWQADVSPPTHPSSRRL